MSMATPSPTGSAVRNISQKNSSKTKSVGTLGNDLLQAPPVIKQCPKATVGGSEEPKVSINMRNGKSGKDGVMSMAMPSPRPKGSAVGNSSHKNSSKANSVGPLGNDLLEAPPVIKECPKATVGGSEEPKVSINMRNDKSGKDGVVSMAMPSPRPKGSALGSSSHKNSSKANSVGALGNDLPEAPLVIKECPKARLGASEEPNVSINMCNGKSGKDGIMSMAMPSPQPKGSAVGNSSHKNSSKVNSVGPLGNDLLETPPVIRERPKARVGESKESMVANIVQNGKSGTRLKGSTVGNSLQKNSVRRFGKDLLGTPSMIPGAMDGGSEESKLSAFVQGRGNDKSLKDEELLSSGPPPGFSVRAGSQKNLSKAAMEDSDGSKHWTSDEEKVVSTALLPNNRLEKTSVEDSLPLIVTKDWNSSSDVLNSCIENKDICLQAACALYRQRMFQPTEGGRSERTGLSQSDARWVTKLAEFLLDGNLNGPMKRSSEELVKHDDAGANLLEMVVLESSDKLFDIFKKKVDPYFC